MQRRSLLQHMALGAVAAPSLGFAATEPERAAPLPLEHFYRRPLMERVSLSPDGKKMAAIINNGSQSLLITRSLAGGAIVTVMNTDNLEFLFNWFRWVNNDRLVVSLRYPYQRQIPYSTRVINTMETRLLSVDADGGNAINVLRSKGLSGATGWAIDQDNVIDWLPEDGKHILLGLPDTDQDRDSSVFKINVYTGARQHYHGTLPDVRNWATDQAHRVRIGVGFNDKSETVVWVSDIEGKNWRVLSKFAAFASDAILPVGFGLDPHILYVTARHAGLQALHTVDLRQPKIDPKLIVAHPRFDLSGSLLYNKAGEAIGFANRSQDSTVLYWDESYKAWKQQIDQALPERRNTISSVSKDETLCVVVSEAPDMPPDFFLCAKDGSKPRLLSRTFPELVGKELSFKQEFSFNARDGLNISCYLSLPPGSKGKNLPFVVFPHGGPQASDGPEFDNWVAFMADRGYAVLQVNYRGSTGYGQAFMDAGLRRWGLEMQDDLTDAVAAVVKKGLADPARVAIVGASYGGYAALMGVCKTPKLYQGAFAFAPVVDLVELVADAGQFRARESVRRQIGEASDDKPRLKETSPNLLAAKIEVPVVLIHGTHDRQAEYQHSVWMADALKANGKKYKFTTQDKGDHQLSHLPYRKQLFEQLETFLLETLGKAA